MTTTSSSPASAAALTTARSRAAAPPGRLLALVVPRRRHVTVLVAGELDCETAPLLREGLTRGLFYRPSQLVVDATDVGFCDLRGLDTLVDGIEAVERSGAHVTVQPSAQLVWLLTTLERLPGTSGRPVRDPAGRPLRRPSRAFA
jgi:anti-anti-sigma factor